jgi:hypothetical protein
VKPESDSMRAERAATPQDATTPPQAHAINTCVASMWMLRRHSQAGFSPAGVLAA